MWGPPRCCSTGHCGGRPRSSPPTGNTPLAGSGGRPAGKSARIGSDEMRRKVTRYVERLLRQRRPRPFVPTDEEAETLSAAVTLRAARPEEAMPRGEFVAALHTKLAEQAARAGESEVAPREQRVGRRRRGFL